MISVVWFFIRWLSVFCMRCLFFVLRVEVVLLRMRMCGFLSMVWVMVMCCFCLFERCMLCLLMVVLRLFGNFLMKVMVFVVMVVVLILFIDVVVLL